MKTLNHKRVVIYTRVSTDEQKENGFSLQDQFSQISMYSERHNWEVLDHYQDDHSAKDFKRPAFQKCLTKIKNKSLRPDLIVVTKIDRFSRDAFDTFEMINQLEKYSVEVFSVMDQQIVNLSNTSSFLQLFMGVGMAQYENLLRSDNTKRGLRQAMRQGRTVCRPPLGYLNDKINKSIIVDTQNAPLVQEGFRMLSTGAYTVEEVRKKLIRKGLKKVCKQTFLNVVRNPYYYGMIVISAWKDDPREEVLGLHTPLISEDLFKSVRRILNGKNKQINGPKTKRPELPLRGFLVCDSCGGNLTGSRSKSRNGDRHFYYHCQKGCKERFRADYANKEFERYLDSFNISMEVLGLYNSILEDVFNHDEVGKLNEIKQLKNNISKVSLKIMSLEDKFLEDQISAEDYGSIKTRLNQDLDSLMNRKNDLSIDESSFQKYFKFGFAVLYNLKDYYKESELDVKRKIVGSIFPNKLVFDKKKYRTAKLNEILSLLTNNINGIGSVVKEKAIISDGLPNMAPPAGLEPATP